MAQHEVAKPTASNTTEYIRDKLTGVLKQKSIPTKVFNSKVAQLLTIDTNVALEVGTAGYVPSGTAPLRVTYLNLGATFERIDYAIADRTGTLDVLSVGTAIAPAGGGVGARGQQLLLRGDQYNPLYVINGTMNIYNTSGSQSTGTYIIAWQGVQ